MQPNDFFESAQNYFDDALPFVLYRKPNTNVVKGVFQDDAEVHYVTDFTESGFVFAPFNNSKKAVIIPSEVSQTIETIFDEDLAFVSEEISHTINDSAKKKHITLVEKSIEAIETDAFKKVVVSREEPVQLKESNPIALYKRLLSQYKTAFVYCWYHPNIGLWLGATPETLLSVVGNRFTTMSLAGTQMVKTDAEVIWEAKETEEQQLVTDFIVSNLKTSVETFLVGKTETIRAGNLLHLRTKISGLLNANLKQVIEALHPTPAVCGLPKQVTKQFILNEETYNREFYTGFLGELNLKEEKSRNTNRRNVENNAYGSIKTVSNLYVNLRCMQLTDVKATIYVGGGITKDSKPEKEWEETVNKAQTMKKVLF